jgi:hypothetical protein
MLLSCLAGQPQQLHACSFAQLCGQFATELRFATISVFISEYKADVLGLIFLVPFMYFLYSMQEIEILLQQDIICRGSNFTMKLM